MKMVTSITCAALLYALGSASCLFAYDATAHASTGRIEEDKSTGVRTVKSNANSYGYVGSIGAKDSAFVVCFQLPSYPATETIDSVTFSAYLNTIADSGGALSNASVYGVRASASPGIQASDYAGGTQVIGSYLSSSLSLGRVEVADTGSTPLITWLNANGSPNEYVVFRVEVDVPQTGYIRYNLSDESVTDEEPELSFTTNTSTPVLYDAVADEQTGYIKENESTGVRTIDTTAGILGYVGGIGSSESVFVMSFQMPDYPVDGTFQSADLSVYANLVSSGVGDASLYAVRSDSSPTLLTSDYAGGTLLISSLLTSATPEDWVDASAGSGSAFVNWLNANAAPNEYVILRVQCDANQSGYTRYNLSDESVSGQEPQLQVGVSSSGGGTPPGSWGSVAFDPAPWQAADGVTWESYSTLETEIENTTSGGTLDLTGRFFRAAPTDSAIIIDDPITIVGGYFSAATDLTWTSIGNGLFEAPIDLSYIGSSGLSNIEDPDAETPPLLAVFPAPPAGIYSENRTVYNDNWWTVKSGSVNNGIIHTTGGDNSTNSSHKITGFTITDSTMRSEVNAAINGEEDSLFLFHHSGPNAVEGVTVASWNSSTGTLMFTEEGLPFSNGYFDFVLSGRYQFIDGEDGAFVFDYAEDRIVYKPEDGDPTGTGVGIIPQIFVVTTNGVTFSDSTFSCTNNNSSAPAIIRGSGSPYPTVTFSECKFTLAVTGTRTMVADMDLCQFNYMLSRGVSAQPGSIITRSRFENIQESSAISIQSSDNLSTIYTAMPTSVIEGNLFNLPAAFHGQGVSLYRDAWMNSTVRNNIFYSCERALAFQPTPSGASQYRNQVPGVMRFENNLVWVSYLANPDGGGQTTIAFNKDDDTFLPVGEQDVFIRHNVVGGDTDDFHGSKFAMTLNKLRHSNVWIDGNIAGTISAAENVMGYNVHQRSHNLLGSAFPSQYGAAYGSTDLPDASSSSVYDRVNLAAIGSAATGASDGGPVGIRWLVIPESSELQDLPLDWVDVAQPQTLPTATNWSDAYSLTDLR